MSVYDINGNALAGFQKARAKVPPLFEPVLSTEIVYTCAVKGDVQSCCANGNVIYYADITNKTINAYNVLTGTLSSNSMPTLGHANGMTYCDEDNCVYLDTQSSPGKLLKINGDTLELVDTINNEFSHSSVAWNRATREFYAKQGGSEGIVRVCDYNWNVLKTFTLSNIPNGTNQSIETDGTFLYFTWCEGTSYYVDNKQHIYAYTLDGVFLRDILPMCSELESLAYNGYGDYYISNCRGASNYGILRKVIPYSDIAAPTANGTYALKAVVSNGYVAYSWGALT